MMTARLFGIELRRLIWRRVFWAAFLASVGVGAYLMWEGRPTEYDLYGQDLPPDLAHSGYLDVQVRLFGALSQNYTQTYMPVFIVPLFVGLSVAGSLAADRGRGYPNLVLIRGVSRARFLFAKATAMAVAAALAFFASCAVVFSISTFFYPWGVTAVLGDVNSVLARDPNALGPFTSLFLYSPLLHDLLTVGLLSLGAAALALSGLAVGTLVKNEYVASAVPFVIVLGGALVPGGALKFLGPDAYLDLWGYGGSSLAVSWPFIAQILYWSAFGTSCVAVSAVVFLRKEPD
jgi:ABC-type transport system involved in multi-copper enzyme maturation permease subunit